MERETGAKTPLSVPRVRRLSSPALASRLGRSGAPLRDRKRVCSPCTSCAMSSVLPLFQNLIQEMHIKLQCFHVMYRYLKPISDMDPNPVP